MELTGSVNKLPSFENVKKKFIEFFYFLLKFCILYLVSSISCTAKYFDTQIKLLL